MKGNAPVRKIQDNKVVQVLKPKCQKEGTLKEEAKEEDISRMGVKVREVKEERTVTNVESPDTLPGSV